MSWNLVQKKHASLSIREKMLVLISGLFLVIFTAFNFFIEPMFVKYSHLEKIRMTTQQSIDTVKLKVKGIEDSLAANPLEDIKKQLAALNVQHQLHSNQLEQYQLSLVASDEMPKLVEEIVYENTKLSLESLTSKEPEAILLQPNESNGEVLLYRHAIAIRMKGEYFSLLDFMKKIEQKEKSVLWGEIDYRVDKYPNAIISFEIFTISTDKEFMGVKK
jgi:MSHA biogenesis protein MshJ